MLPHRHQLTATTLNPVDRQNFKSAERICHPEILALLKEHVPGSEGTVKYLEIMRNYIDAFMSPSLTPLERVYKCWYSIFLVRIWRQFVTSKSEILKVSENFLTSNCYSCLEQNAHSLVMILLYLKRINRPDLFNIMLYGSQPCESFYRQIRSLTPTYSTVTNCTVKEIIERVSKIQLQNEINGDSASNILYPEKLKSCNSQQIDPISLPNQDEILKMIAQAEEDAKVDAIKMNLIKTYAKKKKFGIGIKPFVSKKMKHISTKSDDERKTIYPQQILSQLTSVQLKNYADLFENKVVPEESPYTEIHSSKRRIVIKKMSLAWLLRKNSSRLSSDRLQRVKSGKRKKTQPDKEPISSYLLRPKIKRKRFKSKYN